MITKEDIDDA